MRALVCGSRKWRDRGFVWLRLDSIHHKTPISTLISGKAKGVDTYAEEWAIERGVEFLPFEPDWDDLSHPDAVIRTHPNGTAYDARAGNRRNTRMLVEGKPDKVIAFRGGAGTADMIRQAKAAGVPVWEIKE